MRPKMDHIVRFDRVVDLAEGFESSFGLELLATVHWVVKKERSVSMNDIVRSVHEWSSRKRIIFPPRQIAIAVGVLEDKGRIAPIDKK